MMLTKREFREQMRRIIEPYMKDLLCKLDEVIASNGAPLPSPLEEPDSE